MNYNYNPHALGQYVHLNFENYQQYGVMPPNVRIQSNYGKFREINRNTYIQNRRIQKSNRVTAAAETLEKRIRSEFKSTNENNQDDSYVDQNILNEMYKIVESFATRKASSNFKDFLFSDADKFFGRKLKSMSKEEAQEFKKIKEKVENFIKKLKDLKSKQKTAQPEDIIRKELIELVEEYDEICGIARKDNIETNGKSLQDIIDEYMGYLVYATSASELSGKFGEHFVALLDDSINDVSVEGLKTFFKNSIKGDIASKIIVDYEDFGGSRVSSNSENKIINEYLNETFRAATTQNKTDVTITINKKPINISVKNYGQEEEVAKLQGNISLATALGYANRISGDSFIGNHWLNLHAGMARPFSERSQLADDLIETELAIEALITGNPYKSSINNPPVDVFVYMNYKTGKIFVHSAYDVLINHFNMFNFTPSIRNLYINNDFVAADGNNITNTDAAQRRIVNILRAVRAMRTSVTLAISKFIDKK